jgi:hypothetical protein
VRIHHKRDIGPFFRREPLEVGDLGLVEVCDLCALDRHDVLDLVMVRDLPALSCKEAAALMGSSGSRHGDHLFKNLFRDFQRPHETA